VTLVKHEGDCIVKEPRIGPSIGNLPFNWAVIINVEAVNNSVSYVKFDRQYSDLFKHESIHKSFNNNKLIRVDFQDSITSSSSGKVPVIVATKTPVSTAFMNCIMSKLVSQVRSNHKLVIKITLSKIGPAIKPHLSRVIRIMPETITVIRVTAPASITNMIVQNYHLTSIR